MNSEGLRFLKYIFFIKKQQIYQNKFGKLINHSVPGIFSRDIKKDKNHYTLWFDKFRFYDFGMETKVKDINNLRFYRSKSFSDDMYTK